MFKNSYGLISISKLIGLTLFSACAWLSYKVVPIYYNYLELKNSIQSLVAISDELSDGEIRKKISAQLSELNIPADISDVYFTRYSNSLKITLDYTEEIYLSLYKYEVKIWEFDFSIVESV
jgi:Domain of unknown function (DUF4845)